MNTSRVQLALNVTDLEAATRFYTDLLGTAPAKQRTGYANFEIADPPLKLVLFEHPGAASALNHLGVEMPSTDDVVASAERFRAAGLDQFAGADRCCHAVQDKVSVDAPEVPHRRPSHPVRRDRAPAVTALHAAIVRAPIPAG